MAISDIPQITVDEVKRVLDEKADVILLDVRTPGEYGKGKIEGSINIPIDEISNKIITAVADKNKTVYVYCLSGSRSDMAVAIMQKLGYVNVHSMTNGLLMWRSKKCPIST